jgi:epoxide hydrolase
MTTITTPQQDAQVQPFRIEIPEAQLVDLADRIDRTRWPDEPRDIGWTRGVPLEYLRGLAEYWRTNFDWRMQEEWLNEIPQFTTTIDGQTVHFLHVRSPEEDALPLIATHGWPGSFVELRDLVGPLTNPVSHGADPADAFHLVVPSVPGYAFSLPKHDTGWTDARVAKTWSQLMTQLGYEHYGAHGGDFGAKVSRQLGLLEPDRVVGVHLTEITGSPSREEADMANPAEKKSVEASERYQRELSGYAYLQSTRPQTLAYSLSDSPVGQLAWIVEKFRDWTDSSEEPEDAINRDQMLTIVTLYWLTCSGGSSAHVYADGAASWFAEEEPSTVPTGVALFPRNITYPIRRIAERKNKIVHWTEFDRGGHFPAMEQPDLLVDDLRTFFRPLR